MNQAKSNRGDYFGIAIIGGIMVFYTLVWALLFLAAAIAGGGPKAGIFQFATNIIKIPTQIKNDGGKFIIWHLVGAYGTNFNPVVFVVFIIVILVLLILGVAGTYFLVRGGLPTFGPAFSRNKLKRSSSWAEGRDLRRLWVRGSRKNRFILGVQEHKLIGTEPEIHVLVVGPTRSGKTSALILPNVFDWEGPAVITSTKAEILTYTGGCRQHKGPVSIYDPTGEIGDPAGIGGEGYRTITFSPLASCYVRDDAGVKKPSWDKCWNTGIWMSEGLVQKGGGTQDWEYWASSARQLLGGYLYAAAISNRTMADVYSWVTGQEIQEPLKTISETVKNEPLPKFDVDMAVQMLKGIDGRPEKERGTVFSTVSTLLGIFSEEKVIRSTLTSNFDIDDFLKHKGTLYLITPVQKPERVATLFITILQSIITRAYILSNNMPRGRLDPALGLFLDELANVIPIQDLDNLASQGSGRGVLLMSIIQDIPQLRTRYGDDKTKTIFQNHPATMVLPGIKEPDTHKFICDITGQFQEKDVSTSVSHEGHTSRSTSYRMQQMVTPDALRRLQPGTALLIYRDLPPAIISLRSWFNIKEYITKSKIPYSRLATYVHHSNEK